LQHHSVVQRSNPESFVPCRICRQLQSVLVLAAGSRVSPLQQGARQNLQHLLQEQQHAAHGFLFVLSTSQQC
jgi:hypothetical protein